MPGRRIGTRGHVIEFLVVVAIGGVLVGIMAFSLGGFTRQSQASACATDTKSLQNAEEANYAQAGDYDIESVLVAHGLLSHVSTWHGVRLTHSTPAVPYDSYSITVLGDHCGHNGDRVGQTPSDR